MGITTRKFVCPCCGHPELDSPPYERMGLPPWLDHGLPPYHQRYGKPGHAPITVPVHGNTPLKVGLLHRLMKETGLTEDDL